MATTTNFGWETPDDTDLVKDGAAAIRTALNGVDTSFAELKGGTTGQVLSKASNTDLDFTWVAQDDSNAIQNAIVDAKGDLIAATAADTPARLAVGTNGQVLTADSTAATGLKWATASSGALTLITSGSFTSSSAVNINNCFSSTYNNYKIIVKYTNSDTGTRDARLRLRASGTDATGANYSYGSFGRRDNNADFTTAAASQTQFDIGRANSGNRNYSSFEIISPYLACPTVIYGGYAGDDGATAFFNTVGGNHTLSTSYDGCSIIAQTGNISGNYYIYGLAN